MLEDNIRERLLEKGVSSLSNSELLAIIVNSGIKNASALDISKNVLYRANNSLLDLVKLGVDDLVKIEGIGLSKAVLLVSIFELSRRRYNESIPVKEQIKSSSQVFEMFRDLCDQTYESFWILLLKRNNSVIAKRKISDGGVAGTVVDVKLILKYALDTLSSSIILIHNHPSGSITPSNQDILITKKVKEATKYMDIIVYDHIIIGQDTYYSFSDEGVLC